MPRWATDIEYHPFLTALEKPIHFQEIQHFNGMIWSREFAEVFETERGILRLSDRMCTDPEVFGEMDDVLRPLVGIAAWFVAHRSHQEPSGTQDKFHTDGVCSDFDSHYLFVGVSVDKLERINVGQPQVEFEPYRFSRPFVQFGSADPIDAGFY